MAVDPADDVSAEPERQGTIGEPSPVVLRQPVDASKPLPPIRGAAALAEIHQRWAELAARNSGARAGTGPGDLARRAREVLRPPGQDDRELLGALIRATDALAMRTDELSARLQRLEEHLEDVTLALSEDLVGIRSALASAEVRHRSPEASSGGSPTD